MKSIYLLIFTCMLQLSYGQSVSVLALDITLNGQGFEKSSVFQSSLESVFSNLNRPPLLVERSKMSELIEIIQDEKNISMDFGGSEIDRLNPQNTDYVIFSNLITSPTSDITNLQIECVKIHGESILSKFVFPSIELKDTDMRDLYLFETKVQSVLDKYAFVDKLGVLSNATLEEINRKLENRQREIDEIKNELTTYKDYSEMAELGMDGYGKFRPGPGIKFNSHLSDLMKKATKTKDNKIFPRTTDEAILVIDTVIKDYPRYPFGYYIKSQQYEILGKPEWKEYAEKALQILEKTSKIHAVNAQQIQAMETLKRKLGTY